MATHVVADEIVAVGRRVLCGCESHQPFAYARGDEYYRCCDHTLLARVVDGQLLSAQSGEAIAYQRDSMFYDSITRQPVYYVSSEKLVPGLSTSLDSSDFPAQS